MTLSAVEHVAQGVGFVNSAVADLQGNREPAVSSISAAIAALAGSGGQFERVHEPSPVIAQRLWMADDYKGRRC